MTGNRSRRKGLRGEAEVARVFREADYDVKALEYGGDWLCARRHGWTGPRLHVEVKRQEQLRLREWLNQATLEATAGSVPVVAFRQSGEPWRVCLTLDDLIRVLG